MMCVLTAGNCMDVVARIPVRLEFFGGDYFYFGVRAYPDDGVVVPGVMLLEDERLRVCGFYQCDTMVPSSVLSVFYVSKANGAFDGSLAFLTLRRRGFELEPRSLLDYQI